VDKTLLVELAQRSCKADRKAKEPAQFHRLSQEPIEWLAPSILEYKHWPTFTTNKGERSSRPV
jgi:hypothetical protein